jgi:hypothetical protein
MVTRSPYRQPPAWDKPLVRADSITSLASCSSECSFENDDDCENLPYARYLAESYQAMKNPSLNESLYSRDFMTDRSTYTTSSSGIAFYQSSFRYHFMDRHMDTPSTTHETPHANQQILPRHNRGVDRNISLPRERHVASDLSLSSFTRDITNTPRSIARTISQTFSENSCASKPLSTISSHHGNIQSSSSVSPEVTRPTTQRNPSSSYASPLPAASVPRFPLSRYPSSSTPSAVAAPLRSKPPSTLRVPSLRSNASSRARITSVPTPASGAPANGSHPTAPATPRDKVLLEIAPGVKLHLRGAEETHAAMTNGFFVQCECFLCATTGNEDALYCILDCDYFLCPECRSVYPNPIRTNSTRGLSSTQLPGGLGLGFRMGETNPSGERVAL